jgi:hypothetical protein
VNEHAPIPAVLVTGTIGAGKSALSEEISLVLHERGKLHALIDLDGLSQCYPASPEDPYNVSLAFENLAAVWPNFLRHDIRYAVLALLVERASDLDGVRAALPGAALEVVRVVAPDDVCATRLRGREISPSMLARHLRRSPVLAREIAELTVESFTVDNATRPIREVALEVLANLGWDDGAHA